jgi:excisionase family DNA binding protein
VPSRLSVKTLGLTSSVRARVSVMNPMAIDHEVLTLKEVSELLQISEGTVYKMIKKGKIPSFQIGIEWRFLKHRLVRWMAEHSLPSREFDIGPWIPRGPRR